MERDVEDELAVNEVAGGIPSYATVFTNCIEVKPVTDNGVFHSDVWASLVIARLTGCAYNRLPPLGAADTKVQYAGENTGADITQVQHRTAIFGIGIASIIYTRKHRDV